GKVPILVHGDTWVSESLAISEYLAESFPVPEHPQIFPAHPAQRARARQIMSFLRTSLFALREARPTITIFFQPTTAAMSAKAKEEAADLERIALAVIPEGRTTMFEHWCIADADLGLALMRLVANQDPIAPHLVNYARAQFDRPSVKKFLSYVPPTPYVPPGH
ncbi:MAG TPA: glutathione transferase, partial [Kofleriaceae bacterium]|nr:glutathione transferase [Kofleriaceae bacterium]